MKKLPVALLCHHPAMLLIVFLLLAALPGLSQTTSLVIKTGTTLLVSDKIVLKNTNIVNNGTLNASNGNIYFTGNANTSISSPAAPFIKVFTLNKEGKGAVTLNNDISVTGMVDFKHGLIELNNQTLSLGGSGLLNNEAEDARITGVEGGAVTAYQSEARSSPSQLNIGNLGAVITSPVTQSSIMVSRMHKPATSPNGENSGVQRTYLLQPRNNNALNATLRFYYFDAELNGKNENTLGLWSSEDGITWVKSDVTSRNAEANYIEKTGLPSFAWFTLTDADNPLPVKLVYFRASCQDKYALIEWATATEINAGHFDVEKSTDGTNWAAVQSVPATNNANGSTYSFKDNTPSATAYYRLKIVEKTGTSSYSAVFSGGCRDIAMPFMVSPNPAVSNAVASVSVRQAAQSTIEVITFTGQRLYMAAWALQPGNNQYNLPVKMLAAGTYIVRVLVNNNVLQAKLIKQ